MALTPFLGCSFLSQGRQGLTFFRYFFVHLEETPFFPKKIEKITTGDLTQLTEVKF